MFQDWSDMTIPFKFSKNTRSNVLNFYEDVEIESQADHKVRITIIKFIGN